MKKFIKVKGYLQRLDCRGLATDGREKSIRTRVLFPLFLHTKQVCPVLYRALSAAAPGVGPLPPLGLLRERQQSAALVAGHEVRALLLLFYSSVGSSCCAHNKSLHTLVNPFAILYARISHPYFLAPSAVLLPSIYTGRATWS
jgi:hypothetical protein